MITENTPHDLESDFLVDEKESVLIVDDNSTISLLVAEALDSTGYEVETAENIHEAIEILNNRKHDLIISDIRMPGGSGVDLMKYCINHTMMIPFIMMSGYADSDLIIEALNCGARFFMAKPFSLAAMTEQVDSVLSKQRYDKLHKRFVGHLKEANRTLEQRVTLRTAQLVKMQDAIAIALSGMAETRDNETGEHLARTCEYINCLGNRLIRDGIEGSCLSSEDMDMISRAAILHDIGKVGVPDRILLKPGKLTADEFEEMKRHTVYGSRTLKIAINKFGEDPFLLLAHDVARHHHERWNGGGYPDGLSGENIPFAARLMSLVDVYDALINKRCYKDAMPVEEAEQIIITGKNTQFDPALIDAFIACKDDFRHIGSQCS
ncbi:MAG: response regulator [Planctomycetes bacterium]|nr:response regulator [Planctomycetota bacterium]